MDNPYRLNLSTYSTHNIICNHIGANKVVLDIGCNDGYIGKSADSSNSFYGLDYMPESIRKAKKVYKEALVYDLNKLEKLPWNKKFDLLIFADVLEHVLYPQDVLLFFVRNYLVQNGSVIISLPNIANWQIRLQLLIGNFNYTNSGIMDKTHLHLFTYKSAKALVRNSNLHVKEEMAGASKFGPIANTVKPLKSFLATNIILINEKN